MSIHEQLQSRELGEFPISYGTSSAILLLMDSNSESPSLKEAKNKPEELWINISTLIRNMENCTERKTWEKAKGKDVVKILLSEISMIVAEMRTIYADKLKVVFYQTDYKFLKIDFPKAKLKEAKTPLQLNSKRVEDETLREIKQPLKELIQSDFSIADVPYVEYKIFTRFPESDFKHIWILTHYVVDMIGFKRPKKMFLLESHTARLRRKSEFNEKLTGKPKNIPFNKLTLQIYGDNSNHFLSLGRKFKKEIEELAEKNKWNSSMSEVDVRVALSRMNDRFTSTVFKSML